MRIYINLLLIIILVSACSNKVENNANEAQTENAAKIKKQKEFAKQLFIDASLLDVEGKYAEAILDYQEALKLDPSSGIYYAIAKDYLRLNKLNQALENSQIAVKLSGENTEYLSLLGTIYTLSRNLDSAEVIYSKIVKLDSTDIQAQLSLAQIYENDRPLQALEKYNNVIGETGPQWNILVKIASLNERLGQVEETIKTIENLLELNPSSIDIQKLLIESYIKQEEYDKALTKVDESLEVFPADLNLIELRGNALIKKENWNEGVEEYKKIIDNEKISFETKLRIATAFYGEALNDSALVPYSLSLLEDIEKDSSDWQINAYMGELYNNQGNDSLTLTYFKKAISLAKMNVDLSIRLGQILFENGDYDNAIIEMSNAVDKFPKNFVINLILGLSFAQSNDHITASQYLQKSVELNPNNLNSTLALSFSLNQIDKSDDALKYLDRALRIDSKNLQALGLMGLIYDGKEMYSKSDSIYSIAIGIDSTDILLLNNFAYSLAERGLQLDRALEMVQKAVDEEPENSSYLDTIGWVYFQMGEYDKAEEFIKKAIDNDISNGTLLDHLGDVYYKLGKVDEAKKTWEEALELDPSLEKIIEKLEKGLD